MSAIKVEGAFYRDWGQNEFIFHGTRVSEPYGKRGGGRAMVHRGEAPGSSRGMRVWKRTAAGAGFFQQVSPTANTALPPPLSKGPVRRGPSFGQSVCGARGTVLEYRRGNAGKRGVVGINSPQQGREPSESSSAEALGA